MKDLAISIISSAAVSGLLSAGLIWLSKTWIAERMKNAIKHEYDEKLETHKALLKAQSDVSLERLRCDLQIAATQQGKITLETRNMIQNGIERMASATHSMCWLTWLASSSPSRITEDRVNLYDEEMHVLLPQMISFQARLSTYNSDVSARFGKIITAIECLDMRIGSAALHFLDKGQAGTGELVKCHGKADDLHKRLAKLCSEISIKALVEQP